MKPRVKIGFFINPIAGYGFYTNSKDSIGLTLVERPSISTERAKVFIEHLDFTRISVITASGDMGENLLIEKKVKIHSLYKVKDKITDAEDSINFVKYAIEMGIDLLVFAGGDGTLVDIFREIDARIPVIGVPCGLKMYSGVFAVSPQAAAIAVNSFSPEAPDTKEAEALDLKKGKVHLFGTVLTVASGNIVSSGKLEFTPEGMDGIVEYIMDNMRDSAFYIFGTGGTCKMIEKALGYNSDPLCIDIFKGKKMVKSDASESDMLGLARSGEVYLIVTPIGGQNFIFGHGNRQITSSVISAVGVDRIMIIADPAKLRHIEILYSDTGSKYPDNFARVIYGYGKFKVVRIVS